MVRTHGFTLADDCRITMFGFRLGVTPITRLDLAPADRPKNLCPLGVTIKMVASTIAVVI